MRIGLITYDSPHLKTEQLVCALRARGGHHLTLLGLPFAPRPARQVRLRHRPDMAAGAHPAALAAACDLPFVPVPDAAALPTDFDALVVAGAGLLPPEVVRAVPIVNAHPGLIPAVRGLDSFKWAILEDMPLGITLHLIDEDVDAGQHLAAAHTPVLPADTLDSLARRHYELEIALLAGFEHWLAHPAAPPDLPARPSRKRMPADLEARMLTRFEAYKARFATPTAGLHDADPVRRS